MKNKNIINYHAHTYRCGHAGGTEEEIIIKAINEGFKEFGISEHIPFPDWFKTVMPALFLYRDQELIKRRIYDFLESNNTYGTPTEMIDDYLNTVSDLKIKYQDKIKIYCGFEAECLPQYLPYYKKVFNDKRVDYLIFGNHQSEYPIPGIYSGVKTNKAILDDYLRATELALSTGYYSYMAHPDIFMNYVKRWDKDCEELTHQICKLSLENNFPLEINIDGLRFGLLYSKRYPNDNFWNIVSKYQVPVIIGLDSHCIDNIASEYLDLGIEYAKKYKLNLISKLILKK